MKLNLCPFLKDSHVLQSARGVDLIWNWQETHLEVEKILWNVAIAKIGRRILSQSIFHFLWNQSLYYCCLEFLLGWFQRQVKFELGFPSKMSDIWPLKKVLLRIFRHKIRKDMLWHCNGWESILKNARQKKERALIWSINLFIRVESFLDHDWHWSLDWLQDHHLCSFTLCYIRFQNR